MIRSPLLWMLLLLVPAAAPSASSAPVFLTGDVFWPAPGESPAFAAGGAGLVTLRGTVPNAVLGPARVQDSYRAIDVSRSASVARMLVQGLRAQVGDSCIRAHAEQLIVRDTHCTMVGGPQSGGVNMPFGLEVLAADHVSISDSSFSGFQWQAPPQRYWNGDGITIERDVSSVEFHRVSANDNSDAGFDVRPFASISEASAAGNCRNFRFWSGAEAGTLTSGDVRKRGGISSCSGIWLNGAPDGARPQLHVRKLVVRMHRPGTIIEVETGPADIRIDECDIQAPRGSIMIQFDRAPGRVRLGKHCAIG